MKVNQAIIGIIAALFTSADNHFRKQRDVELKALNNRSKAEAKKKFPITAEMQKKVNAALLNFECISLGELVTGPKKTAFRAFEKKHLQQRRAIFAKYEELSDALDTNQTIMFADLELCDTGAEQRDLIVRMQKWDVTKPWVIKS